MAAPKIARMDLDAFLAWQAGQGVKHELVDGIAVMMTGGTRAHGLIAVNVLAFLRRALRGGPCLPNTSDFKLVTPGGNVRYPDVSVDCARPGGAPLGLGDLAAAAPVLVVEVLSASTGFYDRHAKLEDYKSVPSMRHVLLVWQEEPRAALWSRVAGPAGEVWTHEALRGLDAEVPLPALGLALPLAEVYDGVLARDDLAG